MFRTCRRYWLNAALALAAAGCGGDGTAPKVEDYTTARLTARVGTPAQTLAPGRRALQLGPGRDGILSVPANRAQRAPLVVLLHGAGGSAAAWESTLAVTDSLGIVALAIDSRSYSWDVILGGFGEDVAFLDSALKFVFERVAIDPARVGVAGFSDGASYALSIGLTNGDLFTDVIAWSPGFLEVEARRGTPAIFITHGTSDPVLPIENSSRLIVSRLRGWNYDVRFEEFSGGHVIPAALAREALVALAAGG